MTQTARILAALRSGAATSQQIAKRIGCERRNISVALCRLAAIGVIERAGLVNARRIGRPYVRWRVR
jgi:predicted ArsR family transcriptional regulator